MKHNQIIATSDKKQSTVTKQYQILNTVKVVQNTQSCKKKANSIKTKDCNKTM